MSINRENSAVHGRLDLTDRGHFPNTAPPDPGPSIASDAVPTSGGWDFENKEARMLNEQTIAWFSLDDVADETGGIAEEIRGWIENGDIPLVDGDAARSGRICEIDFKRIEKHQLAADIQRCFKDPNKFLNTKFERFGDRTPRELLDSEDADLVRDLVWQVKSGAN